MKHRKKVFDRIFSNEEREPTFRTDCEYTFEFYQHLLHFDSFSLDMGKALGGQHSLVKLLNGQPLKVMAAHQFKASTVSGEEKENEQLNWLWSFDIWHESLYRTAAEHKRNSEKVFKPQC